MVLFPVREGAFAVAKCGVFAKKTAVAVQDRDGCLYSNAPGRGPSGGLMVWRIRR